MAAGLKMAQEADQPGGIRAERQKRRPRSRRRHDEGKWAGGVEVGCRDPSLDLDPAGTELIQASHFRFDGVVIHGLILAGGQKKQIT